MNKFSSLKKMENQMRQEGVGTKVRHGAHCVGTFCAILQSVIHE
jgi:hypothetical protein